MQHCIVSFPRRRESIWRLIFPRPHRFPAFAGMTARRYGKVKRLPTHDCHTFAMSQPGADRVAGLQTFVSRSAGCTRPTFYLCCHEAYPACLPAIHGWKATWVLAHRPMPCESSLTNATLRRVIPAKAEIHLAVDLFEAVWIPACAGMTELRFGGPVGRNQYCAE